MKATSHLLSHPARHGAASQVVPPVNKPNPCHSQDHTADGPSAAIQDIDPSSSLTWITAEDTITKATKSWQSIRFHFRGTVFFQATVCPCSKCSRSCPPPRSPPLSVAQSSSALLKVLMQGHGTPTHPFAIHAWSKYYANCQTNCSCPTITVEATCSYHTLTT
jgi:hypothetical protein